MTAAAPAATPVLDPEHLHRLLEGHLRLVTSSVNQNRGATAAKARGLFATFTLPARQHGGTGASRGRPPDPGPRAPHGGESRCGYIPWNLSDFSSSKGAFRLSHYLL